MLSFRGGVIFVATQALGWALFTSALVSLIWLSSLVASGVAYCIRCWALATGGVMFAAQVVRLSMEPRQCPYTMHQNMKNMSSVLGGVSVSTLCVKALKVVDGRDVQANDTGLRGVGLLKSEQPARFGTHCALER